MNPNERLHPRSVTRCPDSKMMKKALADFAQYQADREEINNSLVPVDPRRTYGQPRHTFSHLRKSKVCAGCKERRSVVLYPLAKAQKRMVFSAFCIYCIVSRDQRKLKEVCLERKLERQELKRRRNGNGRQAQQKVRSV